MQSSKLKSWFSKPKVGFVIAVILAFVAGYIIRGPGSSDSSQRAAPQKWYCSMDPEIIRDKPGKCPKCGMDLIPMPLDLAASIGPRVLVVSEEAAKLMEIETTTVERKFVTTEIRMVGKIDYDETRVKNITAWVPGRSRIERLFIDFTGITVKKGEHMVDLYSPELISAQAELLLSSTKLLAREKLRLLGLTAEQIEQIEKTGKPVDYLTITPQSAEWLFTRMPPKVCTLRRVLSFILLQTCRDFGSSWTLTSPTCRGCNTDRKLNLRPKPILVKFSKAGLLLSTPYSTIKHEPSRSE